MFRWKGHKSYAVYWITCFMCSSFSVWNAWLRGKIYSFQVKFWYGGTKNCHYWKDKTRQGSTKSRNEKYVVTSRFCWKGNFQKYFFALCGLPYQITVPTAKLNNEILLYKPDFHQSVLTFATFCHYSYQLVRTCPIWQVIFKKVSSLVFVFLAWMKTMHFLQWKKLTHSERSLSAKAIPKKRSYVNFPSASLVTFR